MRLWSINILTALAVWLLGSEKAYADSVGCKAWSVELPADTLVESQPVATVADSMILQPQINEKSQPVENAKQQKRKDRYIRHWASLIPNKFSLQYAGDIGFLSLGLGWDYGRHNQWETHIFMGYVPENHTQDGFWSFTLKEVYIPWRIKFHEKFCLEPFYCTLFMNSVLNSDFWTKEPDRYPKGYYGFSSKIRFHLGFGQRITVNIPTARRFFADRFSLYYGVSTCDLYVRQKFLNSNVPLKDIICLTVGVQYTIE